MHKIGFANQYYTLWNIWNEMMYKVDHNGKAWPTHTKTHYEYIQNVSTDLDKVKSKHPELEIDEELKGVYRSFSKERKEDLTPELLKFGKYNGYTVQEVSEIDFNYLLWLINNCYSGNTVDEIKKLPSVIEYFKNIEDSNNKLIADNERAFNELLKAGVIEFEAEKNLRIHDDFAYITNGSITFKFMPRTYSYNEYKGHSYGLPIVNGKAKRMKGKTIRIEFTKDETEVYQVIVNKVEVLK